MKKVDIILGILIAEITAWFFYSVLRDIEKFVSLLTRLNITPELFGLILAVLFPILTIIALWLSWFLGKKFLVIFQAAKYLLTGVLATIIDLGVLNFLMGISGIYRGSIYAIFKGISFLTATFAKYWANKFWAFEKKEMVGVGKEFTQFLLVTLVGFGINVGIASLVVNTIGPQFGITSKLWGIIGGVVAAFGAFIWNFLGYKFIVFKK